MGHPQNRLSIGLRCYDVPCAAPWLLRSEHLGHAPFQTELLRIVQQLVAESPIGVVRLSVCPAPDPFFEIRPANRKAARFFGYAAADDLDLIIGYAQREFVGFGRGSNVVRGATWQEELRWIWDAVVAGGFTQRHYLDANGGVIAWAMKLMVHGEQVVFRNGKREKLFGRAYASESVVTYEPYF